MVKPLIGLKGSTATTGRMWPRVSSNRSLGAVVKGSDGKDLGQLNDFVIDSRDGRVVYGVVAGSGDKLYAVPFSSFTMQSDMEFHLSMTQDKVFSGPAFSRSDASRQSFAHDLYLYYGLQPTWE